MVRIINKGWGREVIFADTEYYAGKLLEFNQGAKFSMHFHAVKDETWYVLKGKFQLTRIHTNCAEDVITTLSEGDTEHIRPLVPHQLKCLEEGTIIEVSMPDSVEDNYRVRPGDSQNV